MPPRVMEEKKKAVMLNRERGSQQPSSLSPDLLRRTYPAVKSIESEAESVVEARLQGSSFQYSFIWRFSVNPCDDLLFQCHCTTERTSNTEDIPGEILSGSTLDKLLELGTQEKATK